MKHKVVLQTNLSPGDIVTIKKSSETRKVREVKATNSCYFVSFESGYGTNIFSIESIKDKDVRRFLLEFWFCWMFMDFWEDVTFEEVK